MSYRNDFSLEFASLCQLRASFVCGQVIFHLSDLLMSSLLPSGSSFALLQFILERVKVTSEQDLMRPASLVTISRDERVTDMLIGLRGQLW